VRDEELIGDDYHKLDDEDQPEDDEMIADVKVCYPILAILCCGKIFSTTKCNLKLIAL
jgi:hypothetical protein